MLTKRFQSDFLLLVVAFSLVSYKLANTVKGCCHALDRADRTTGRCRKERQSKNRRATRARVEIIRQLRMGDASLQLKNQTVEAGDLNDSSSVLVAPKVLVKNPGC
jgi:hypothetical protein